MWPSCGSTTSDGQKIADNEKMWEHSLKISLNFLYYFSNISSCMTLRLFKYPWSKYFSTSCLRMCRVHWPRTGILYRCSSFFYDISNMAAVPYTMGLLSCGGTSVDDASCAVNTLANFQAKEKTVSSRGPILNLVFSKASFCIFTSLELSCLSFYLCRIFSSSLM